MKKNYNVKIGKYTYGGCFRDNFNTGGTVEIGRYCSIGSNVHYYGTNHPIDHATMSPYFYLKGFGGLDVKDVPSFKLTIGNDVWIGGNVNIVSGCSNIGNGAVIANSAVVTKDVPPYAVVAGVPAKIIKYRFDDETIKLLEKSHWYNLEPSDLMNYYEYIDKPKQFSELIIQSNIENR